MTFNLNQSFVIKKVITFVTEKRKKGKHSADLPQKTKKEMDKLQLNSNVQIVCNINDLRQIFNDWQQEQQQKEQQKQQQQEKESYLSVAEVCQLLNVTKPTLWRWSKLNYLVPVKVGKKNYYKRSDIEALRKG